MSPFCAKDFFANINEEPVVFDEVRRLTKALRDVFNGVTKMIENRRLDPHPDGLDDIDPKTVNSLKEFNTLCPLTLLLQTFVKAFHLYLVQMKDAKATIELTSEYREHQRRASHASRVWSTWDQTERQVDAGKHYLSKRFIEKYHTSQAERPPSVTLRLGRSSSCL